MVSTVGRNSVPTRGFCGACSGGLATLRTEKGHFEGQNLQHLGLLPLSLTYLFPKGTRIYCTNRIRTYV